MSYQALLFCPDEKTARTVTQVLSELEFNVTPCTEPFAAVKKLMGERFDAIVVDCDNEQNATLLFKSARSAPNNQSALAVAVVEGQAGVAKAFRIGANLVLTKPINVEQAKGTLRVARGLLRKNDGAKTGAPASTPVGTSSATPGAKLAALEHMPPPVLNAPAPVMSAATPVVTERPEAAATAAPEHMVSASSATEEAKPLPQTMATMTASAPAQSPRSPQSISSKIIAASAAAPARPTSTSAAASAPAPARETKSAGNAELIADTPTEKKKVAEIAPAIPELVPAAPTPAPTLSFGGAVDSAKPESSGSKMKFIAAAAIVIVAVASYAVWTKFGSSAKTSNSAAPTVATSPTATQTSATPSRPASASSPAVSAADSKSAGAEVSENPKSESAKSTGAKQLPHVGKSAAQESTKTAPAEIAENSAPAPRPMVIKNERSKSFITSTDSVEAPALSVAAVPSGEALPNLVGSSNAPTPVLQKMVVSQGVSRGLLIKQVQPVYPRNALDFRVEGAVQLMATVSKNGDISELKVLSGDKNLARAAAEAVKQWKYKPYLLNGEPVDIQTQITVNFKLPR